MRRMGSVTREQEGGWGIQQAELLTGTLNIKRAFKIACMEKKAVCVVTPNSSHGM